MDLRAASLDPRVSERVTRARRVAIFYAVCLPPLLCLFHWLLFTVWQLPPRQLWSLSYWATVGISVSAAIQATRTAWATGHMTGRGALFQEGVRLMPFSQFAWLFGWLAVSWAGVASWASASARFVIGAGGLACVIVGHFKFEARIRACLKDQAG